MTSFLLNQNQLIRRFSMIVKTEMATQLPDIRKKVSGSTKKIGHEFGLKNKEIEQVIETCYRELLCRIN